VAPKKKDAPSVKGGRVTRAKAREAVLERQGVAAWTPPAKVEPDRRKERSKRACRVRPDGEET